MLRYKGYALGTDKIIGIRVGLGGYISLYREKKTWFSGVVVRTSDL